MELRVQLKVCEGCGCLWYRAQHQGSVYCRSCETKLREFPVATDDYRPGVSRKRKPVLKIWAVADSGGAE